ncbi:unnamed protein product [Didymodactylos carnosus]|uniref:Uncharacterized protein n=1 Tax=Didymodactylos carnosus TaxID=1234261 RepID=A0A8S2FVB5_9BILA|nr:unnamed protein product [Didymodactylos carnosus]CAF4362601.1 unnamed protein product [Didymodactylos carnosus]
MGTIFQIESIEELDGKIWYIKLILSSEEKELNELLNHFKNDIEKTPNLFTFGVYLYKMGDYIKAEKYFRIIFRQQSMNPLDKAIIFNCIGALYDEKGNYDRALKLYKKALILQLKFKILFTDPIRLSMMFNNIGHVFDNKGQYNLALKYYKKALQTDRTLSRVSESDISAVYGNIGCVQIKQGKFRLALKNLTKALNLRLKYLPSNHQRIFTYTLCNVDVRPCVHFQ